MAKISHEAPKITILSDHPAQDRDKGTGIGEVEHIADRDLLTLESRLSPVFDILRHKNTRSPLTIAIYGTWGTGKTSAMRWLETRLGEWNSPDNKARDGHPKVHPIWFDPWRYHSREEVWRGIIAEVILALFSVERKDKKDIVHGLVQAAKKFGAFLGRGFIAALASIKVKVKGKLPGVGEAEIGVDGEAARDIWEAYDKANHPEKAHLNQFEDTLRTWVRDFMPKHDDGTDRERIAIFIDDLDRCLPDVTLEVLEALKLYLNIPSLNYVVGLDREVVDAVVAKKYRDNDIPPEKARSYLDKIFQVDLTIPPSQRQMEGFLESQIRALNAATDSHWDKQLDACEQKKRVHDAIAALAKHNPREIKRLLNSALIRGRNAEQDRTLDEQFKQAKVSRAERFASGVQVFLLQRLARTLLLGADNLLITEAHANWFEKASSLARAVADAKDSEITHGDALAQALAALRSKDAEEKTGLARVASAIEKEIIPVKGALDALEKHLQTGAPTRDNGSAIDAEFWESPLLWDILLIPFHAAIAQSAPRLETAPKAQAAPVADLTACSPAFRERLARAAMVAPDALTPNHLGAVRKLELDKIPVTAADMSVLSSLTQLQTLYLRDTKVSDVSALEGLTQLQVLLLVRTKVSDVSALAGLTQLKRLSLRGTNVSDVSALAGLTQLNWLSLSGTPVSDVSALESLTHLKDIYLLATQVSKEQVVALKKALPKLEVHVGAMADAWKG